MENKKLILFCMVIVLVLCPFLQGQGVPVTQAPENLASLDARWDWALKTAAGIKDKSGFHIGFSILRNMSEHSTFGDWSGRGPNKTSLYEIIYKKKPPVSKSSLWDKSVPELARTVLEDSKKQHQPEKKVLKEVAILFQFSTGKNYPLNLKKVKVSNIELPVDLKDSPLFWLGKADNRESTALLVSFFTEVDQSASTEIKEDIVTAVGLHEPAAEILNFLKKIVKSNQPEDVRDNAVFWMGAQPYREAVQILADTVANDSSAKVRKKAVFGLYLNPLPEAVDILIRLAKQGKEHEIRKKAIFWLGQKASKQIAAVLTDIISEDKDVEIQKTAVFALSQLPDNQGIPQLITISKTHKSLAVRKKAIFWLSQSDDPRALDTIIEIINR